MERQWRKEAGLRQLFHPVPLPVVWSDSVLEEIADHAQSIGGAVSCRTDQLEELSAMFRRLPRRRLVVLGPAGSGKSTFAVVLALSLLEGRERDEPVPVLLSAASFDPEHESLHAWLCRRIAADYPALTDGDTYGAGAVEDLMSGHRVLPVVDGLDELPESARPKVLEALNDTFDAHPHARVVLTCRTEAYTAAVAAADVLAGAAVVEPAPVDAVDALELLRRSRPARWNGLAGHVARSPHGPVAQALSSPLMVALARTVYADAPPGPDELERFTSREAFEDHLLDALVPTVHARALRQDPSGPRRWSPECAHRHLAELAAGMQRQGIYDLTWWQLHRWVPTLAYAWSRAAFWTVALIGLTLLGYGVSCVVPGLPAADWGATTWYLLGMAAATPSMCLFAAWYAARRGPGASRLLGAALTAVCGGVAFAVPGVTFAPVHGVPPGLYIVGCGCFVGFAFLLVLHTTGLPVPPVMPSRGTLSTRHWRHRLPRAAAVFAGTTVLTGAALRVYALVVVPPQKTPGGDPSQTPELPWTYGLSMGAVFGAVQALLYWLRGTTSADDLTTPASAVRADRLVTLVGGGVGVLLITLPHDILAVLEASTAPHGAALDVVLPRLAVTFLGVGPAGLVLALAASSWPHYTVARLVLAARGRLPWRLQDFLADAHRLGVLRQVGPVHQFRHARLQQRLAQQVHLPGPRTSPAGSDAPSRR
ncbi:NACHT domain-containing protein [Streptomyces sp. CB03238]|uniref:NACHT domain-containing protein n=1 Tax=Streptomyces sp. CB03238 TaxID=1907777 RepID=UPI001180E92C|nr:NACHT domain-containing protein [Streptomyces sp. CB03238]